MLSLKVKHQKVSYAAVGTGEPVILLHGGGSSSRQWRSLASSLEDRFVCYTPDLYGHGSSSHWTGTSAPTLNDYADIVDAIADHPGRPFHLVGHSHGGAVAISYATRNLDALLSLTLIEPTLMHLLREAGEDEVWREAEELGTKHMKAVAAGKASEIADEFLPYWIGEAAWQSMPDERRAAIIETMPAVAQFWASEFAETTPAETYEQLAVPTLLIRGTRTRATAHAIIELLGGLMPNARTLEIEGAGHMAPLTHMAEVNAAVENHIMDYSRIT